MKLAVVVAATLSVLAFHVNGADAKENGIVRVGGEGRAVFVNTCGADTSVLKGALEKFENIAQVKFAIEPGTWKLSAAKKCYDDAKANIAVFIVNDEALPMSLIAMEAKWGVVNAQGLDAKCISKESLRVLAVLMGGASSRYPASVMQPVFSKEDLATKAGEVITFDAVMAFRSYCTALGITPFQMMSRKDAEAEGLLPFEKEK